MARGATPAHAPARPLGTATAILWTCRRDLQVALHGRASVVIVLAFFLLVTSLYPLAIGAEPALLRAIGAGVIWVATLLANLLALPRLFTSDQADGTLEQMVLSGAPLPALVSGKVLAHWLLAILPLALLAPLVALQFGLEGTQVGLLLASLLLGTPALAWLGALGAALTLGARGGAALLALLVLPLLAPIVIFGAGAVAAGASGLGARPYLSLLAAASILACVAGPYATALAVRIAQE